jgi:hypothetical protein
MVRKGVVEPLVTLARAGLDPKSGGDREAERYALLVLANLSVTRENHKAIMDAGLDLLVGMCKSPDLRCRQHSIFALGNLASQPANGDMIVEGGCVKPIISFAFPGDLNVQFQAVAALRGLSMQSHIRLQIVRAGALEPLILAAGSDSVEVQREVAATLANLTMAEENKVCVAVVWCDVMSSHVMSCHVMSCHVMSSHVMSCHVMSCHVPYYSCVGS